MQIFVTFVGMKLPVSFKNISNRLDENRGSNKCHFIYPPALNNEKNKKDEKEKERKKEKIKKGKGRYVEEIPTRRQTYEM